MKAITKAEHESLVQGIYQSLMSSEEMGMGEMGEAREEAQRVVDEWMEKNSITCPELGFTDMSPEDQYLVMWTIDIEGVDSPEAAAKIAWELRNSKDSIANHFVVCQKASGYLTEVDLQKVKLQQKRGPKPMNRKRSSNPEHGLHH